MFLNEGERENFLITQRVLESSKKKEREREGAGERKSSWNVLMNEGEKESKRGVEIVDNVWRRKRKKRRKTYG